MLVLGKGTIHYLKIFEKPMFQDADDCIKKWQKRLLQETEYNWLLTLEKKKRNKFIFIIAPWSMDISPISHRKEMEF